MTDDLVVVLERMLSALQQEHLSVLHELGMARAELNRIYAAERKAAGGV